MRARGRRSGFSFVIPLLCGNHSYSDKDRAMKQCSHPEMLNQIEQTVPPTMRQQRSEKFEKRSLLVPKSGMSERLHAG
jgi:hypothetical protein